MKRTLFLALMLISLTATAQRDIYGFTARGQGGREIPMSEYQGKVVLIVNTATHCGFTPQYAPLQQLYEKYKDRGLVILDFPCNQFGQQAPEAIKQINQFCETNYNTTFQRFDKVLVNGQGATPLFTYLKKKLPFQGFDLRTEIGRAMNEMLLNQDLTYASNNDVKWNFTKFLVNRRGRPVKRFEPTTDIAEVEAAILKLL